MKTITFALFALFALFLPVVSAAPIQVIPEHIPFGKSLVTKALANVTKGTTVVSGEGLSKPSQMSFSFAPVDSTDELAGIIRSYKPSVRGKNALKPVFVRSSLMNAAGEELLVAYRSFRHVVRRDSVGRKTYVVPKDAGNLYYEVAQQEFLVPNTETAVAVSVDGNVYELFVGKNGEIRIPSFIASNPEYWNYIQLSMSDGQIVQYDQGGTRLRETVNLFEPAYIGVQSITSVELQDGLLSTILSPEYGWSPIIQFTNTEKQYVTVDLRNQGWTRPTFVRVYTLDQERAGTKSAWIEYDLEGSQNYQDSIQIPLEPGTWFIETEWPTWIQPETGGKG